MSKTSRSLLARCETAAWSIMIGLAILACGSRTPLPAPDDEATDTTSPEDASFSVDGAPVRRDGGGDAALPFDALPPLDARPPVDVNRDDCPDAAETLVYLMTTDGELLSFYPPTAQFRRIGVIACPAPRGTTPFSMAVDRQGTAYVLFNDGQLYRVSTATAACVATNMPVGQLGFETFGMGYAADNGGPAETLHVASDEPGPPGSPGNGRLGTIDTNSFQLGVVGSFRPSVSRAELTGTGGGDLYAFYSDDGTGTGNAFVGQIDKRTATVVAADPLPGVQQGGAWAFAFWGGDFWLFTCPGVSCRRSRVTRFRPEDKSIAIVGIYSGEIVGAGVSTCAPQR